MLKIWGRLTSINVQKVVWCADELGIAYERVEAGGDFGVVNTAEYRRMNPNGLVPVIEDAGFVLWESNAIVRYLAARHGEGSLWPADLKLPLGCVLERPADGLAFDRCRSRAGKPLCHRTSRRAHHHQYRGGRRRGTGTRAHRHWVS